MRLISWTLRSGSEHQILNLVFIFFKNLAVTWRGDLKVESNIHKHEGVVKIRGTWRRNFVLFFAAMS